MRLQNHLAYTQMMMAWKTKDRWRTGDLLVRLNSDCSEIVQMLVYTFPSFIVTGIKLVASFAFLWIMDAQLAQLILAVTPLFLFSKIYYKKMRKITQKVKRTESQVGSVLQENLKNRSLIQALLFLEARNDKLTNVQELNFQIKAKQLKFSMLSRSIIKLTFNGGYLLAFLWGIFRLHTGQISYGTMAAFLQLVGRVQTPVFSMVGFLPALIRCRTSIERIMEMNRGELEEYGNPVKLEPPLSLKLHQLSYRYDEIDVIRQLSVTFQSGVPTAVTGASGKGKTTLIRLILALIKPDSGSLTWTQGSNNISHAVSVATRNNIAYVPQGNTLFCGTIRENLLLADATASKERIDEALKTSCAEFVYTLPDGMDTVIGESGHGLSEGQALRIAIARALLRGGSIWLFDEPTSAIDTDTTKRLIKNLIEAGKEKILIFVTHDRHLTEACSQVVQLD
jgi:ABC-type multidrug transport system fused ATPase/permease subunit